MNFDVAGSIARPVKSCLAWIAEQRIRVCRDRRNGGRGHMQSH